MKKIDNLFMRAKKLVVSAPFKVIFRDGRIKKCSVADAIPLLQQNDVTAIEHDENDTGNGLLPLLIKDLLDDGSGTKEEQEEKNET